MTLNPDLVFDQGCEVGDVKYKILSRDWLRSDLYQLTTFTEGYRSNRGILIGFSESNKKIPERIQIGDIQLSAAAWPSTSGLEPDQAASSLCNQVYNWLKERDLVRQPR